MTTLGKPGLGIGSTITKDEALQPIRSSVRQRESRSAIRRIAPITMIPAM
jgi:hypothetical protein